MRAFIGYLTLAVVLSGPVVLAYCPSPDSIAGLEGASEDPPEPLYDGLGSHHRKVSTSSESAQRYFDQGLKLLFAFNHDEAARSFRQAATLDPECAMAWWGVAAAQGPHINRPKVEAGPAATAHEAITRARMNSDRATELERALIEALATRCVPAPPDDRSALDRAYADAMEAIWAKFPRDPDVGALTAEALMNLRPWDLYTQDANPQPGTERIVELLESVLALCPTHPLANHLYIHAVEASSQPERASIAADRLRDLQPGLSHHVHMPSHIDVRLGHWKAAEDTNRKAIEADRRFLAIRSDPGFFGLYIAHNYHMLGYAAMMRGECQTATQAIDDLMTRMPESWAREHAALADGYLVMPLEVRLRFGRWGEVLDAPEPDPLFPLARALRHHARAVAYVTQDRLEEARVEREQLRAERSRLPETSTFGNNKGSDLLNLAEHAIDGEILFREGHQEEGLAALREAVRCEDRLRYSEPPDWILPVRHALGAALMQARRFGEAEEVYRQDLKRLPENGWSLFGLARALELQGKGAEAEQVRARWSEAWRDADVRLSSSCFCQPGI